MGFSKHLRDALRAYVFGSHEHQNPDISDFPSFRTDTEYNNGPYANKIEYGGYDIYNYDHDARGSNGQNAPGGAESGGVIYRIFPLSSSDFKNRITADEGDELYNFMHTSGNKCELRVVVQNQRRTHRRDTRGVNSTTGKGRYPQGQGANMRTPGDLTDVASMLGYRGSDNVNYGNTMQTWPDDNPSGNTPGYGYRHDPAEAYITNLDTQSGHHPVSGHVHPKTSGKFAAGGYASIIGPGSGKMHWASGGTAPTTFRELITTYPTCGFNSITCSFPTPGVRYHLNANFVRFNNPYDNNGDINTSNVILDYNAGHGRGDMATTERDTPIVDQQAFAFYEYKRTIDGSTLLNGNVSSSSASNGLYLYFPIIYHAMKALKRRDRTTYNTYIPDSFNYTIALVFYNQAGSTIYDIIFDRLRVIDRYDITQIAQSGTDEYSEDCGNYLQHHLHPNLTFIRADSKWTYVNQESRFYATFSNVPPAGVIKHFNNPSGNILYNGGMGCAENLNQQRKNSLLDYCAVMIATKDSYAKPISFVDGEGITGSLSASYNVNTKKLTVCGDTSITYNPIYADSNRTPLLVFYE